MKNDNTKEVKVNLTAGRDDECQPIQCVCGYGKDPWSFNISIYENDPTECPECGRKYFFEGLGVKVFLIVSNNKGEEDGI